MGTKLIDKYSLLHLASGIVSFYWGFSLLSALAVHTVFEVLENSARGIHVIDTYLSARALGGFGWPGGKGSRDSVVNSTGDTIAFLMGWCIAYAAWPGTATLPQAAS